MIPWFPFQELNAWYKKNGRHDLPWRKYDYKEKQLGYRVWLAETMLQQTQVERVKEYFHNILAAFPTIEDLAKTSYEEFFPYYKWLGYYSRARNMLAAAQMVVQDFWWVFPKETEKLRKLPGVWPYTAEAIRAFAYDIPTLSFDTNLEKIFSRYYYGNKYQKLHKNEKSKILEDFIQSKIPARDINNALMDYGATVSLNNISGLDWKNYPLTCSKFYQTLGTLEPIKEKKKSTFPSKKAHIICILHENHKKYFSPSWFTGIPLIERGQKKSPSKREMSEGQREFQVFYIGKNNWNPRAMIQQYFLERYGLELSVRPPEIKSYNREETPYMICYAQIQSGSHSFQTFENIKVRGFEEGLIDGMEFGENLSLF